MLSRRAWEILACPSCGAALTRVQDSAECSACRTRYPASSEGQLDMRLQNPKRYTLDLELSRRGPVREGFEFEMLKPNPVPAFDAGGIRLTPDLTFGNRLTPDLLTHFPRAGDGGGFMLDLGCDRRNFADVCARTNLEYIGLDYQGDAPDLLGDAHALPFKDEVFGFILCIAVLEHLRHPLVALREAHRVLKPDGLLIGSVAFLEPFHMDSYYHHSFLGTCNSLVTAGFDVLQVSPNTKWTGLQALASMMFFPGLPRWITQLLLLPLRVLTRLWWSYEDIRYQTRGTWEMWRQNATTAGYWFIAVKPRADGTQR